MTTRRLTDRHDATSECQWGTERAIAPLRCRPTLGSSRRDAQPRKVAKGTTSAGSGALAPTTNLLEAKVSTNGNLDESRFAEPEVLWIHLARAGENRRRNLDVGWSAPDVGWREAHSGRFRG